MGLLDRFTRDPRKRFARQVLERVRREGVAQAWFDEGEYAIGFRRREGEEPGWIYLHKSFTETRGAGRGVVRGRIDTLIEAVVNRPDLPETWAEAKGHLRPVLRPVTFAQGLPRRDDGQDTRPLSRPALPFLKEMVVIDTPRAMAYVTLRQPAQWHVSVEDVFDTARANLAAGQSGLPREAGGPRLIRFVDDGDAYYTSLPLLPGWLAQRAEDLGARPVVCLPDNNSMILTDDRPEGMEQLLKMVEQSYLEAARAISPQAYTVDADGSVIEYPAQPGHPARNAVRRAARVLAASEYSSQKAWLEREPDEDVFVAGYQVMRDPQGEVLSWSTWPSEVDTLLPRTDVIAFSGSPEDVFTVPWDTVAGLVELTPVEGLEPERFRVRQWPEPQVIEQLRAARTHRPL